jgi:hypothetical protein
LSAFARSSRSLLKIPRQEKRGAPEARWIAKLNAAEVFLFFDRFHSMSARPSVAGVW